MKKSIGAETIVYPTPVLVVGTYDAKGKAECHGCCLVRHLLFRSTLRCYCLEKGHLYLWQIVLQKAFTVSIPSEKHARAADYFGIASGRNTNKFDVSGLTPVKSALVNAPYIEEFPLVLECKLIHQVEIGLHTQFIGEILDIKAEEGVLDEKGMPDIEKVRRFFYDPGAYAYYRIGEFLGAAFSIGKDLKKKA